MERIFCLPEILIEALVILVFCTCPGIVIPRYLCILVVAIPSTEILFAHGLSPPLWSDTGMVLVADYFDTSSGCCFEGSGKKEEKE